jgi:hypothetical protein
MAAAAAAADNADGDVDVDADADVENVRPALPVLATGALVALGHDGPWAPLPSSQQAFSKPAIPAPTPPPPPAPIAEDDQDGTTCSICFETWTHEGPHRIVSLRCGHLFGHACIDRWLTQHRLCPMCKKTAALREVRPIFARLIVAVDAGERDRALELAERHRRDADAARAAEAHSRLQASMNLTELQQARAELKALRRQIELCVHGPVLPSRARPCDSPGGEGHRLESRAGASPSVGAMAPTMTAAAALAPAFLLRRTVRVAIEVGVAWSCLALVRPRA